MTSPGRLGAIRAMIATLTLWAPMAACLAVGAGGPERPFLDPVYTDHAVLQRDAVLPIRGWAEPGSKVQVKIAGRTAGATADGSGCWVAKVGPLPAGGPHEMEVSGPQSAIVRDLLVGDVWICSGQSNMEWGVNSSDRPREEVAAADHPRIRLMTIPKRIEAAPAEVVDAKWEVCTPETVGPFSAVGYFFGRDLRREVDVPIGLINTSWGGTVAEAWVSAGSLGAMPDFRDAIAAVAEDGREPDRGRRAFERKMADWWARNDPGSRDKPTWADPGYDAAAWKAMDLPGNWEQKGLADYDGIAWFRKEIDLPGTWEGKGATLDLGPIDDRDTTFVNGQAVGGQDGWLASRSYKLAPGVLRPGRNVIAVRVLDTGGLGGFMGDSRALKLAAEGDGEAPEPIALAGRWSYKEAAAMADLSAPPEPEGGGPNRATVLYNGMIAPLGPMAIKGAIWYQGESNAGRAEQYRALLPTLIRDWRGRFAAGDFPFLVVQLANYMKRKDQAVESGWAELREAQAMATRALPNVGLATAIDIGEADDIHPRNKQEVGRRLSLQALAIGYGRPEVVPSGPVYKSMSVDGRSARIAFDHVGAGLAVKGGGPLEGFAIAGDDGKFRRAEAAIDGDSVVVTSPEVEHPRSVRYAWANNPACNLSNQAGLPANPFRTDGPTP